MLNTVSATPTDTSDTIDFKEEEAFTSTEVAPVIRGLKSGKAAGKNKIQPKMLKTLNGEGARWLRRVFTGICQMAWKVGKTPQNWQTGIIFIYYIGDR